MSSYYRSIFISDVHLGTPDCQATYLLDFLRSTRSEHLYLVGDIVDLESLVRRAHWPQAHALILAEIYAIAQRGTRVVYIPGNHDAPMRALCGRNLGGIEVRRSCEHRAADGRRYRVSHGDEFDLPGEREGWLNRVGEVLHRALLLRINRGVNSLRRLLGLPYLPFAIVTKSRLVRAWSYIRSFAARVGADTAAAGFHGHICGQIHYGTIERIDGVLYLNDGDWVEHCTALIEHASGRMELLHWSEHQTSIAQHHDGVLEPAPALPMAFASLSPDRVAALRARQPAPPIDTGIAAAEAA